ncbi:sensor histidine kinase [Spirosoma flavum]|uniref:Sensor histidine kinase n=1 Tax=Spirosoma flavum TaxID=2048557 RepID=A0ABW6AH71_9BACT
MMFSSIRSLFVRIVRRLAVWLLIGISIYMINGAYIRSDEGPIKNLVLFAMYSLVILIYEVNVHWLFVRYLYNARWIQFLSGSIALLGTVHTLTYIIYPLLQLVAHISESKIVAGPSGSSLFYWYRIHQLGVLGWLYNWEAISLVLLNPYFYASLFLLATLFRYYLSLGSDVRQTELTNLALNQENNLLELDLLKAQLNPHFLLNALNSIYARVINADEQAANLVLRLAELMRYNLYETEAPTVSLDQELGYIENYLQLEQARHGQRVEILFSNEGMDEHLFIVPLILLAFVENAFKHGVGGQQQEAYVWVEAHIEQTATLIFTVQNSLATSVQRHFPDQKSGGIGLPNVRQRLALLYPNAHQIDVEHSVDSYAVTLTLQLA